MKIGKYSDELPNPFNHINLRLIGIEELLRKIVIRLNMSDIDKIEGDFKLKEVEELNVSVRSFNILKAAHINYIGELIKYSKNELLRMRNIGEICVNEIQEELKRIGLSLSED